MKKIIADARVDVFLICNCFRNGEQEGRYHSPEFTMLEYYTMGADYMDSLAITERLFAALYQAFPDAPRQAAPPFVRMTMEEAFIRYAHFSLEEALANGSLREKAAALGIDAPADAGDGIIYNLVFIHAVEPQLALEGPVALLDYPAIVPCLAKALPQKSACKQRWELYAGGVELANCYTEETKAEEVRAFFASEAAEKKAHGLVAHAVDADYWKMFLPVAGTDGDVLRYPECSGVALGMDRLIMLLCGKSDIAGVLPCAHAND
jgi:lysyl-tRNA synthetase class 2